MKIKICSVDEDGRYGGPQARNISIFTKLNKKKFSFFFLIPTKKKIFKKKIIDLKANFAEFDITRLSKSFFLLIKYFFFFPVEVYFLSNFFKKKKFNIIQANGSTHFKTVIAAYVAKIPCLWVIEDSYSPRPILEIFRLIVKILNVNIIYISDKVHDFYLKKFKQKNNFFKIESLVDCSHFKRKKFFTKEKLIVTSISGLIPVKDVITFLNVANAVIKKFQNVEFHFYGANTESEKKYYQKVNSIFKNFEPEVRKKIKFNDLNLNVKNILLNTDIFLCTSISEGGPIVILEAMSMQTPVVTTKVGNTSEYIKDGFNGYLCDVGNVKQLSNRISILIQDEKKRKLFFKNSRKSIVNIFSDLKIVKKYQKLYERIAK